MTSIEQLERKARLLQIIYKKIGDAIEAHEFNYASILSQDLIKELDYANHISNMLADIGQELNI